MIQKNPIVQKKEAIAKQFILEQLRMRQLYVLLGLVHAIGIKAREDCARRNAPNKGRKNWAPKLLAWHRKCCRALIEFTRENNLCWQHIKEVAVRIKRPSVVSEAVSEVV